MPSAALTASIGCGAVATLVALSGARNAARARKLIQTLTRAPAPAVAGARNDLPPLVAAYAARAGAAARRAPRLVQFSQTGSMNLTEGGKPARFTAAQITAVAVPEFVWRAALRVGPVPLRVIDALVDGRASLDARAFGVVPLAHAADSETLRQGEVMRYLAELMWNPDAILHNRAIAWAAPAPDVMAARIDVGAKTCEVRFMVEPNGEVVRCEASDRPRLVGRRAVPTAWRGSYSRYRLLGERLLPTYAEVAWLIDGTACTYWRGHLDNWQAVY